jgi:lysophospholipid acyltransferase (LPLAT)-like uncharacterized protein
MKIPIDPLRLTPFVSLLYKLWVHSLRMEDQGAWRSLLHCREAGHRFVLCLWHEEIFAVTGYGYTKTRKLVTFVSKSKDGEFIARILHTLGHATTRGSSSRGGLRAILEAKRIMERENRMAVFTIDGPQGPRHVPKNGPIFLAQKAKAKIVPLRAFPQNKVIFHKSWDHFQLPYPFARCPVRIGVPYSVTREKLTESVLSRERERLRWEMDKLALQSSSEPPQSYQQFNDLFR